MKEAKEKNKTSELRQDLVTGDWVVISTVRAKRPQEYSNHERQESVEISGKPCIFCDPAASGQEKDVLIYQKTDGDWSLRVIPNKYPAFIRPTGKSVKHEDEGPYFMMEAVGYHELIITRDHNRSLAQLDKYQVAEVVDAYQERYIELMSKSSVNLIEIFHNHGREAGASIAHPHSQLVAIPVISPYIRAELDGAEKYWRGNRHCVYCAMLQWELEHKKRVIFENESFVAFCPFASRAAFEVWIMPKKHKPYFERTSVEDKLKIGEALQVVLAKMFNGLNNPAYNFYLHTSPADGKDYPHFHWHIEILPRLSVWAGLEYSTGIEINTMEPEVAAEFLRKN